MTSRTQKELENQFSRKNLDQFIFSWKEQGVE